MQLSLQVLFLECYRSGGRSFVRSSALTLARGACPKNVGPKCVARQNVVLTEEVLLSSRTPSPSEESRTISRTSPVFNVDSKYPSVSSVDFVSRLPKVKA